MVDKGIASLFLLLPGEVKICCCCWSKKSPHSWIPVIVKSFDGVGENSSERSQMKPDGTKVQYLKEAP